ncbi:MAG: glycerol acyltransferase [Chitinophagaceae bacterium]|nr:MAG: glycerol acyltransferase [Chitinophagaceae bacterium]
MLYRLLKIPATIGFWLYCRDLKVNNNGPFALDGPLIIACNHPNSFLDAIILSALFKRPVYSLARGDAFKKHFIARILRSLKMLPVYRSSEGVENMEHNYSTFDTCKELFKKNAIVLIFSEGRCVNEWHLRPLKKGTARLALSSWADGIDVKILPTGLNYNRFHSYDKNLHCLFGKVISKKDVDLGNGFGKSVHSFNGLLEKELQPLIYEIDKADLQKRKDIFEINVPAWKMLLLSVPALLGYVFHYPIYSIAKFFAVKFGADNDHYDSILVALLFLFYPFYLLLFCMVFYLTGFHEWSLLLLALLPVCAWSYLHVKQQF